MDTTTVHTANSDAEAQVIAGLLREQGIEVITDVESPYTEAPTAGGEGTVRIDVPVGDADRAREALRTAEGSGTADAPDAGRREGGVTPPPYT